VNVIEWLTVDLAALSHLADDGQQQVIDFALPPAEFLSKETEKCFVSQSTDNVQASLPLKRVKIRKSPFKRLFRFIHCRMVIRISLE